MKPYFYVSRFGISRWQLEVLLTLYCAEGIGKKAMTQTQIAATYCQNPCAVASKVKKAIQNLVSYQFISSIEGKASTGKCNYVSLTDTGRKFMDTMIGE